MRRLAIYLIYDKDNIVDRYIGYMIDKLVLCVERLIVVVNGTNIVQGEEYLCNASDIYYRENTGYDAGGFKECLEKYIGWNELKRYDELVMLNDSFYGPFRSFISIFESMKDKTCDFWGASMHAEALYKGTIIKEHLQSFFVVIKRRMLLSDDFRNYWSLLPCFTSFNEVVEEHEMKFTKYFKEKGYIYESLADMASNNSEKKSANFCQYIFLQYELVSKRNFPFLKKKPVCLNTLDMQTQENWRLAIEYIKNYTDYDVDMIYENMIRLFDESDLQRKFLLQYVISEKNYDISGNRAVIVVKVNIEAAIQYIKEYIDNIRERVDIVIYSNKKNICRCFENDKYRCYLGNSSDEELLSGILKYNYICFVDDCNIMNGERYSTIEKSFFYNVWDNLIKSGDYIGGIIELLDNNKRLGVLTMPASIHADYFGKRHKFWLNNYERILDIISQNKIKCVISRDKMPVVCSSNVWVRREVLLNVIHHKLLQKDELDYLWSYVAQSLGLYSGIVENETYSSMNQINQQIYLDSIISQIFRQTGTIKTFSDLQERITGIQIQQFSSKYQQIYVYGTGALAEEYEPLIPNIIGYIVSDGQQKKNKNVIYLSELKNSDKIGVIVCLNEGNQSQVVPLLKKKKINYLCI